MQKEYASRNIKNLSRELVSEFTSVRAHNNRTTTTTTTSIIRGVEGEEDGRSTCFSPEIPERIASSVERRALQTHQNGVAFEDLECRGVVAAAVAGVAARIDPAIRVASHAVEKKAKNR